MNALIQLLGYTPVDQGSLRNSREIEDLPVQRFPNWKCPLILSWIVFTVRAALLAAAINILGYFFGGLLFGSGL